MICLLPLSARYVHAVVDGKATVIDLDFFRAINDAADGRAPSIEVKRPAIPVNLSEPGEPAERWQRTPLSSS